MAEQPRHAVDPAEPLMSSRDKQVGLRWPMAVDDRLDALLMRARAAAEKTTRRELVAAILCSVDLSGDELSSLIRSYRRMSVADALLDRPKDDTVIEMEHRRPGPRP